MKHFKQVCTIDYTINVITLFKAPNSSPQNVSIQVYNSTSLNLSWIVPPVEHHNGIIQYYIIWMRVINTGYSENFTSYNTWIVLTSLHPYYTYIFQIAAVTVEQGPFSTNISITMPEAS